MVYPGTAKLPVGLTFLRLLSFPRKLGILERLYGRSLAQHGECWIECSNSVVWKLDLRDPTHRWIVYGDYQGAAMMRWVVEWMSEGGLFVDSGANIGQVLLYVAPLDRVSVIAFEPFPAAREWLNECLSRQSGWYVDVMDIGLGRKPEQREMQCDGARSTTNLEWYKTRSLPRISINIDSLDRFASDNDVDRIRLWKLDVEGGEHEALLGAEGLLKAGAIEAILLECNPRNYHAVNELLRKHGYGIRKPTRKGLEKVLAGEERLKDFVVVKEQSFSARL